MALPTPDDLGPWPEAPPPSPETPPEPSDKMPAWVRLLLSEAEQGLSGKLRWKIMLRKLDLDGPSKAILLWLWDRMYGTRVAAFPTHRQLVADSGFSRRIVVDVLLWAERYGLIAVERRRRDAGRKHAGTQRSSRYLLTWPPRRPPRRHQGAGGAP